MAITQAICNPFKKQLLEADMNFKSSGGDKFYIALYSSTATLNSATTAYTASSEVPNTGTYAAGGGLLVNSGTSITAGVARVDFGDRSFTGVTLTARGALIYNNSSDTTKASVCALDFGADKTATSGTFTIQFPAPTSTAAILRISG
jgi:hypothetical protein|tara:strand:- start:133 stop:573 length:441 start_codon:yes stop_codon:yes gene_type:complete